MSTYAIGDVHGCYNELQRMLDTISLSDDDRLILTGDYIDRGPDSLRMLRWLEDCPANITPVRGNHDEEFAAYVDLLRRVDACWGLGTDPNVHSDAVALYDTASYLLKTIRLDSVRHFDLYGTIGELLHSTSIVLNDLIRWAEMIRRMPYYVELYIRGRLCIVVHAGYRKRFSAEEDAREFFLYAREAACREGGVRHGMVVAGHTPTILKGEYAYRGGRVYRHYDWVRDCTFYDIDCGCVFRDRFPDARLACLRLEDEEAFYL